MSVSNYIPNECLYRIDKLDDVVYLIPEQALRNIKIDNGEAYIENIQYQPLVFNCYGISLEDTESLDERYEFSHTLKFSINGYVNHNDFNGNYYAIVKSMDNEYWLVNPKFPCKVTYTYTLGYNDSHTDFTLSTISNHPTLRIRNMNQVRPYPCSGYTLDGFDQLLLNEKDYSARYGNYVRYTNSGFSEVRYDKKSATFTEEFDGTNVSHTIQFNIKFDDYKDSWHYNLLEFTDNLYSAVIKTSGKEYVLCGFGFGLQPSYTVTSNGEVSTPDHIQIVLKDSHNNGDLITFITGGTISPITGQTTFQFTTDYDGWECVGDGVAKYLLQKEYDAFGNPTGRYKCLQGYEEQFSYLNLAGTFDEVETFDQPLCKTQQCNLYTSLLSPLNVYAMQCSNFTIKADSDWTLVNTASFLQFSPTSGEAGVEYTVNMCNSRAIDAASISSAFTIQYCDTATTYNVNIFPRSACFYNGDERTITSDGQYVIFPTQCCTKEATEYSGDTLTDIQLMETYIKIYVPQNTSETPRTFVVTVTLCNGDIADLIIHQGNGFYRWVTEGTTCVGTQKCDVQRMYSGTTSGDINTRTEVLRTANCVESTDCSGSEKRWVVTEETVCYNGRKYVVEAEQVKPTADSPWIYTGNKRRGSETQDSPAECAEVVYEYRWVTATTTTCIGYDKYQEYKKQQSVIGSSVWQDVVPAAYSYDGDGTMTPILIEANSTDCGYVPPVVWQYRWIITDSTTCVGYDKYKLYKKQQSSDSGVTWSDVVPPTYSYNGDGTMTPVLVESESSDCGYVVQYKWQVISGYTCSGCTKYQTTQKFQSTDSGQTWTEVIPAEYGLGNVIEYGSTDCGCSTQYRWVVVSGEYICIDTTKYYKEKKQVSYDNGVTWSDVVPEETRANGIIEEDSPDCGGQQPIERWVDGTMCDSCVPYKVTSFTTGGTNVSVTCNTSTTLTYSEITNRTALSSSTIGSCVNIIGDGAYSGCTALSNVRIPSTISSIGTRAFYNCVGLLDASMPDSVTSIGDYAFSGCTQLSMINLPNYLTSLGVATFRDSLNFQTINIPRTLTYIPNQCFYNCDGLSDIVLPSSITSIGNEAFRECSGLYNLTLYSTTPPTLGTNALYNINLNIRIFVPSASVNAYKTASGWSLYKSRIQAITS